MYKPVQPIIITRFEHEGLFDSAYHVLHSNGSYLRTTKGDIYCRAPQGNRRIFYKYETRNEVRIGNIADKILVERIAEYMECHYGKKYTNCASFAHFLTAGELVECSDETESGMFVLKNGMSVYQGQKIRVGDMLAVLYANPSLSSRKSSLRAAYRQVQKRRHQDGRFVHSFKAKHKSYTATEISDFGVKSFATNFHFLVCVAIYNNQPVWISQGGHYHPSAEEASAIVLTIGECDGYPEHVPLLSFIKRRRRVA